MKVALILISVYRRAKDKNLAKRAFKIADETNELDSHATLESTSPTTPIPKAEANHSFEQCIDFVASPNGDYCHEFVSSSSYSSPATAQPETDSTGHTLTNNSLSGSISPVEELFHRKFDLSSPPAVFNSVLLPSQVAPGSNLHRPPMPLAVSQSTFNEGIATQPISLPKNIFAPRKSLPHIRAPAYGQDLQHQRSTSTPSFLSNVDTTSDLSLTTCASINGVISMYPQHPAQSAYSPRYQPHDRVRRVPSGPLPTTDFTFGGETERDFDASPYGRYTQFHSVSGSDTPSSVSGFSQYGSVQSIAESFEEEQVQAPYGWYPGRRGS